MSYFSFDVQKSKKCAVIGCHGTGCAISYALAQSGMVDSLVLIDSDKRLSEGQAADLLGALPPQSDMDIWAGEFSDLSNCALIVLATGFPALHESAHADLIALNTPNVRHMLSQIATYTSDAVVLVLCEPVDIMTQIAVRYSESSAQRILGIGTLPLCLRYNSLLAKYLGADASQVHSMILGQADEHAVICKNHIYVCGMPLESYLKAIGRSIDMTIPLSLFDDALSAQRRAEDAKGRADYSLAKATLLVADAVLHDRNTVFPISRLSEQYCELPEVCISLPCRLGKHGAQIIPEILPDPAELEQLQKSASRLRAQLLDCEALLQK